mgnify:CR=1 FL=1
MTTVSKVFSRIDTNADKTISTDEAKAYAVSAGVTGSAYGVDLPSAAADAFQETYDADGSGGTSWAEFSARKTSVFPANNVSDLMSADSDGDGNVSRAELTAKIASGLSGLGKGTKAEVAAKLQIKNMDDDGDGKISREEATSLAADISPTLVSSLQSQLRAARTRV